ncbi:MAG: phosphatase PAP2 family protein [Acidimicrobiia bacterium]|nr:phosphatase PAP2 family protein [Acidimicrobiia bacterium]
MPAGPNPRRPTAVLGGVLVAVLASVWLPGIALNTRLADSVVSITNTAAWPQLVFLAVGLVLAVISRPGITHRRRRREVAAFGLVLLVFLAGNAALNEYVVKPLFGIPRPNIEALAQAGALGAEFADADAFYSVGNKTARREPLAERLATLQEPKLSERVRAHWAHETGYSFPSGHSTAAMTLAALLVATGVAWLDGWRWVLAVLAMPVWAVAVVYSRVLLEVHTGADVIAGTVAGFGWGLVAFAVVARLVSRVEPSPPGKAAAAG